MFSEVLQTLKAKVSKNNKIKFILRKVFNFILFVIRLFNLPAVIIISILKDELHMINFYIDRHIIKPLNIYQYKNDRDLPICVWESGVWVHAGIL